MSETTPASLTRSWLIKQIPRVSQLTVVCAFVGHDDTCCFIFTIMSPHIGQTHLSATLNILLNLSPIHTKLDKWHLLHYIIYFWMFLPYKIHFVVRRKNARLSRLPTNAVSEFGFKQWTSPKTLNDMSEWPGGVQICHYVTLWLAERWVCPKCGDMIV